MTGLLLIGGGGHCKAAIDVIEEEGRFTIAGIVERDDTDKAPVLGYPLVGTDGDLPDLVNTHRAAIVTIGQIKTPEPRIRAFNAAQAAGADLPVVVSPRAHVARSATLQDGTLVMHGAIVNADAAIGRNCIVNSLALVEHDARIGDHCHIATGARINGGVAIADGCFIGSGAIIINGVSIGAGSVVGAGCVVREDLPAASVVTHTQRRSA
jgi:sugar O-acyltransferase (sialic acid O-acetyltransferase NeuD family)